jgi:alanyl-tRNA synthetase
LLELSDRLKGKLGDVSTVVLATVSDGKAHFLVSVTPEAAKRGLSAAKILEQVNEKVGGGGGGRDTLARGAIPDAGKVDEALAIAFSVVEAQAK